MMFDGKVYFHGESYVVRVAQFGNGRACVLLVGNEDDPSDHIRVSVNMDDSIPLADDQTIVKDYGENAGVLAALVSAGVLEATERTVEGGFVSMTICRLLMPLRQWSQAPRHPLAMWPPDGAES